MFRFGSRIARKWVCVGGVVASLAVTVVSAQTAPASGLGQSWPNAPDRSASPYWHAYVFERHGVRYIQINDRNGTVHAAIGRVGDTLFALPVGMDAQHVGITTTQRAGASSQTVYQDDTIIVTASPQSDGTVQIMAEVAGCDNPVNCTS
ncbi:MAG TPA: hypothetical protein VL997_08845, partial [Dyella sp.]|nr:hypothetical protein [Dyella sp.]